MERIADLALEYLLLIHLASEDIINPDYSLKVAESLDMQSLSEAEQNTLSLAAQRLKDRINAPPDEYGYQPGLLISAQERAFIDAIISKMAFKS